MDILPHIINNLALFASPNVAQGLHVVVVDGGTRFLRSEHAVGELWGAGFSDAVHPHERQAAVQAVPSKPTLNFCQTLNTEVILE